MYCLSIDIAVPACQLPLLLLPPAVAAAAAAMLLLTITLNTWHALTMPKPTPQPCLIESQQ
jgi:hypothetical protein